MSSAISTTVVSNNDHGNDINNNEAPSEKNDDVPSGDIASGDNQNFIPVQDFMSYLAKETNISNMTVETSDGRRISARFEGEIAVPAPNTALSPETGPFKSKQTTTSTVATTPITDATTDAATVSNNTATSSSHETIKMEEGKTDSTLASSSLLTPGLEAFTSKDWSVNYQNKHVEVTALLLKNRNAIGTETEEGGSDTEGSDGKPKWNAMSALVDAATVAQLQREQVATGTGAGAASVTKVTAEGISKKKATKRKPRKVIPDVKEYVEFSQKDILFGRGGRSNHHLGNKTYRDIVTKQQAHYRSCDKNDKTKVAQGIVDQVNNEIGGRFLELDKDCQRWFLVPNVVARRKVGQALRENNTEEARAAKRAKYQGKLHNLKADVKSGDDSNSFAPSAANNSNSVKDIIPVVTTEANNSVVPIDIAESTTTKVEV